MPLNIYRASAGSGKTYTLTGEYLRLLMKDPENYRRILAVTFTNKAAEEMKQRILKQLNRLATGRESGYRSRFMQEFGLSGEAVDLRARSALSGILHHYADFHISTIDSFFQNVIRSFIREIGIDAGCEIELDNAKVLGEITDRLLLDIEHDRQLRDWLIGFAEEQVESGRSWDVKRPIRNLGGEIFKETFKLLPGGARQQLQNRDNLKAYQSRLVALRARFEEELREMAGAWLRAMEAAGLAIDDFSYAGGGLAGYPQKLAAGKFEPPGQRVQKALEPGSPWCPAKAPAAVRQRVERARDGVLQGLLRDMAVYYESNCAAYETARAMLRHFGTLGILVDLSLKIREYCDDNSVLLLSDAGELLDAVIGDSDAPFVYEKTGLRIHHFMIDEFQDTSRIQWKDFLPLMRNSLAQGFDNLVVGDVKQSIYRWRNSDWKILGAEIQGDIPDFREITLGKNYRSGSAVVEFNNGLFERAAAVLQGAMNREMGIPVAAGPIIDAYADIRQEPAAGGDEGLVQIDFIDTGGSAGWEEAAQARIPGMLENLQEQGFRLQDIAILVREKKQGSEIARFLMDYGAGPKARKGFRYDVVSDEAIYLKNSHAVQFMTAVLRSLVSPEDNITRAQVLHLYFRHIAPGQDVDRGHGLFDAGAGSRLFDRHIRARLAGAGAAACLSLGELAEKMMHAFGLSARTDQLPYLQAFQDTVQEYVRTSPPDIESFLAWWDEQGQTRSVPVCPEQDAVRILTIHKAKGLEFRAVIIPCCSWPLDHPAIHENIVWCSPKQRPFNALRSVPMSYHSLKKTVFSEEYYAEKTLAYVDSLNLLYVAFTRARDRLYVLAPRVPAPEKLGDAGSLVHLCLQDMPGAFPDQAVFRTGREAAAGHGGGDDDPYPCRITRRSCELREYSCLPVRKQLKQRFVSPERFEAAQESLLRGRMLHDVFSWIRTAGDLEAALRRLRLQGRITAEEQAGLALKISGLLADPDVACWFSGDWEIRTEADVLLPGGAFRRPDRVLTRGRRAVVIDYKFGALGAEAYRDQVREYASILRDMGYAPVEGYLWFVEENRIEKVIEPEYRN